MATILGKTQHAPAPSIHPIFKISTSPSHANMQISEYAHFYYSFQSIKMLRSTKQDFTNKWMMPL